MATRIVPYTADHIAGARAFNARLTAAGIKDFRIADEPPELAAGAELPAVDRDWHLLLHEDEVRGGFMLQRQPFWLAGQVHDVRNIQTPLTEGLIDKKYSFLAMLMMRMLAREHPQVFAVGMGGLEEPFPLLLRALRWRLEPVPFFFRIAKPRRVLRQLPQLRSNPLRRALAEAGALTGLGSLAIRSLQRSRRRADVRLRAVAVNPDDGWGEWADDVWANACRSYSMIGLRDRGALRALYPESGRYLSYAFEMGQRIVGWSVLLDMQMHANKHFGDLRVGTILDGLCLPGLEADLLRHSAALLRDRGVDVVVANFNHEDWRQGLLGAGFLAYRSNYLLGASPRLVSTLQPISENWPRIQLTRGDGDGRIHL